MNSIFLPMLVQAFLTFYLYLALAAAKSKAVKSGEVNEARRALYDDAWPESVQKINNCIRNQFELPILFYVICLTLWALPAVNPLTLTLSWLFVLSRFIHMYIHTGKNVVAIRRKVFTAGYFIVSTLAVIAAYYALQSA